MLDLRRLFLPALANQAHEAKAGGEHRKSGCNGSSDGIVAWKVVAPIELNRRELLRMSRRTE